VVLRYMMAQF